MFVFVSMRGQNLKFENLSGEKGLMSNEVYNMHQDKNGYIWLFTATGTQVYNGREFRHVLKNLEPDEQFIYSAYERKDGRMWVANSRATIYEIINDSAFEVKGIDKELAPLLRKTISEIKKLVVDDSNNIYIETKRYSFKLEHREGKFVSRDLRELISRDSIFFYVLNVHGEIIGVYNRRGPEIPSPLFHTDSLGVENALTGFKRFSLIKGRIKSAVRGFKLLGNQLLFSHENRLGRIGPDGKVAYVDFNSIIHNFNMDSRGHLWVACFNDGLYELCEGRIIAHHLPDLTINDVLIDFQGGIWASTPTHGIFHCADPRAETFAASHPMGKPVAFLRELDNGVAIAGTKGDILLVDSSERITFIRKNSSEGRPMDILETGEQHIVTYRDKIEILDKGKVVRNIVYPDGFPISGIQLLRLTRDSVLVVQSKGFVFLRNNVFAHRTVLDCKMFAAIKRANVVYLCTDDGLYQLAGEEMKRPVFLEPTKGMSISRPALDKAGNLYFCANGHGFFMLTPGGKLIHESTKRQLPSDYVSRITFTESGKLVLACNLGVFIEEPSADSLKKWRNIYPEASGDAIVFNNKLYSHSKGELMLLDLKSSVKTPTYYFHFIGVKADSLVLGLKQTSYDIPEGTRQLEFQFDYVSFQRSSPPMKFDLQGPVDENGLSKTYNLQLKHLDPGNYTLTVQPDLPGGVAFQKIVLFKVTPTLYQTFWFQLLLSLFIIAFISLLTWSIFRQRKKQADIKKEAQRLVLEYQLVALKAQINPHFMSNCLSSIQNLIVTNHVIPATEYISMFGLLVRKILNFSTRSFVTIAEEVEVATLYLQLEQLRFDNKFEFEIEIQEGIAVREIYVPALILNPILENAVLHGVSRLDSGKKGQIKMLFQSSNEQLTITITDNGPGIDEEKIYSKRESKGLELVRQRLENINTLHGVDYCTLTLNSSADKRKQGMAATIVLPLHLNEHAE